MSAAVATKRRFSNDANGDDITQKKQKTTKDKKTNVIDPETGLSKCFHRIRAKMYLSLAPCYLEKPIQGLRQQHLDPLIMTYNPTVEGIIITYNNVRLSKENLNTSDDEHFKYVSKVSDENPFSFVWALVDFVIWRPCNGDILEGYSVMQSQSHIGLLINDVFNASIKKFYIPEDWHFVPNQADESNQGENKNFKSLGHWCDSNDVPVGGKIKFTVRAIHVNGKGLAIEGTLLTPDTERDTQPVMLDNIKDNIKKHVKFDGADESIIEEEDIEKLPVIEPLKDDSASVPEINDDDSDEADNSDAPKDDAPKYNDSSDSDSDKDSSDSDSDSDSNGADKDDVESSD